MRFILATFVLGLCLHARIWAQEELSPAAASPDDPGAADGAPGEPPPDGEEPKKEPAPEGEPAKEPAAEGEPKPEPAPEPKPEPAKSEAASEEGYAEDGPLSDLLGFPVHGRLAIRWRGRWQASRHSRDADQDLYQEISADIGNTKKHTLTAHFNLRVSEDLDGEHRYDGAFAFDSLADTYRSRVHGDLYYAHLDLHRLLFVETIRAGRQTLDETPMVFHMDGIRADSMPWEKVLKLQAGGYAGVPVHYHESVWRGDAIYGGWIQARPWKGARARVEYTRIRDAYRHFTSRNDLWTFSAWQTLWDMLTLSGRYTIMDGSSRDHSLRGDLFVAEWDFRVNASWYRLYKRQDLSSIDTDYFTWTLRSYFPYDQFQLLVAKGLGKHVNLQAGADLRAVSPYDEEGPGNRSYQRYFFSPGLLDWPINGLSVTATLEYWNVKHSSSGDTKSAGFDITYKPHKGVKISAGSSFALYKYDELEDVEREHVQTYYLKVSYSPWKPLKFELGYQFEDTDTDDFHTAKFAVIFTY